MNLESSGRKASVWGRQTTEPGLTLGTPDGCQQASSLIRQACIFQRRLWAVWEQTGRGGKRQAGEPREEAPTESADPRLVWKGRL